MRVLKSLLPGILILINSDILFAQGKTSLNFLKIPVSARSSAMAGSFSTITDESVISVYNPAGIIYIPGNNFSAMHLEWLQEINYENLSMNFKYREYPVGINMSYLYVNDIKRTIIDEGSIEGYSEAGNYSVEDKSILIATAYKIREKLSFGIAMRYTIEKIYLYSGSALSIDLGFLHHINKKFRYCFVIQNLSTGIKFIKKKEMLPSLIKTAFGYKNKNLNTVLEMEKGIDTSLILRTGIEFNLKRFIYLRAGYKYNSGGNQYVGKDKLSNYFGFTAGIGINVFNYRFDYAFVPYGALGYVHYFSISGEF